jgi:phosphatidylglycerol:prolipoprotein diacylglycerol transferase
MSPRLAYSTFMILALIVFLLARQVLPRAEGLRTLPCWQRSCLVLAALVGGVLGAKLPFVLQSSEGFFQSSAWLADGKTITTGLIGAYLAVELAKLALGVTVKTGDSFALPLALGLAVGRWGCFFNGCCYGEPTDLPWGVDFGDGIYRHPTQAYEVLFHLGMVCVLWMLMRVGALRCQRLKLYLIAYGAFRFLTEFIRPEPRGWLGLTFYQWVALVLVVGLSLQWLADRQRAVTVQGSQVIVS